MATAAKKNGATPIYLKFWAVLRPFFTSENEKKVSAWGWLILMMALLVLESGVLVAFSYTQVQQCRLIRCCFTQGWDQFEICRRRTL